MCGPGAEIELLMEKEEEQKILHLILKKKYFDKWKKEEHDAEQKMRNERYAVRLAVNGS